MQALMRWFSEKMCVRVFFFFFSFVASNISTLSSSTENEENQVDWNWLVYGVPDPIDCKPPRWVCCLGLLGLAAGSCY